ncbi:MAG: TetR/AcrR family transcriptional regulator [Candidatus Binatia bacterium]|nr:TetR/AcrR family transcriptional regulator [Candidatus Binatia bacterium]
MGLPDAKPTRGSRRKQRNRERLVTAAATILSRKGVDAATIAEITEEADLGFGTFYNHFESKEAIVDEVLSSGLEALGAALDRLTQGMDDPARVLATCFRHLLATPDRDPVWAWFILRMPDASTRLTQHFQHRALRDVEEGVRSGRFKRGHAASLTIALSGLILEGMRAKLSGTATNEIDPHLTSYSLRLLGVSEDEAQQLAHGPLPPIE